MTKGEYRLAILKALHEIGINDVPALKKRMSWVEAYDGDIYNQLKALKRMGLVLSEDDEGVTRAGNQKQVYSLTEQAMFLLESDMDDVDSAMFLEPK